MDMQSQSVPSTREGGCKDVQGLEVSEPELTYP